MAERPKNSMAFGKDRKQVAPKFIYKFLNNRETEQNKVQ